MNMPNDQTTTIKSSLPATLQTRDSLHVKESNFPQTNISSNHIAHKPTYQKIKQPTIRHQTDTTSSPQKYIQEIVHIFNLTKPQLYNF